MNPSFWNASPSNGPDGVEDPQGTLKGPPGGPEEVPNPLYMTLTRQLMSISRVYFYRIILTELCKVSEFKIILGCEP